MSQGYWHRGVGRWFNYYAIDAETGEQTYVGALRFPIDSSGQYPSIMTEGFGSWIEHPHLVSSPSDVPLWNVAIGRPVANGGIYLAQSANWWFGPPTDYWQNSDIWAVGEFINAKLGDDTQRIHGETGSLVYCNAITLSPGTLPQGTVGIAYSETITATGGVASYTYAITSGSVPTGLSLSTSGVLSGTPTVVGAFNFTVKATDANTCAGSNDYSVTITLTPPSVSTVTKKGSPFRIVVKGTNIQSGIKVYINNSGTEWSPVTWKSATKVIIGGGSTLKAAVPKGTPTNFTFLNPDGGTTTLTGWSW